MVRLVWRVGATREGKRLELRRSMRARGQDRSLGIPKFCAAQTPMNSEQRMSPRVRVAEGGHLGSNLLFAGARISAKNGVLSENLVILQLVLRWQIDGVGGGGFNISAASTAPSAHTAALETNDWVSVVRFTVCLRQPLRRPAVADGPPKASPHHVPLQ
jgi:hypothetical protein